MRRERAYHFELGFLEILFEIVPRGRDYGMTSSHPRGLQGETPDTLVLEYCPADVIYEMIRCHPWGFQGELAGTWVPVTRVLASDRGGNKASIEYYW